MLERLAVYTIPIIHIAMYSDILTLFIIDLC